VLLLFFLQGTKHLFARLLRHNAVAELLGSANIFGGGSSFCATGWYLFAIGGTRNQILLIFTNSDYIWKLLVNF